MGPHLIHNLAFSLFGASIARGLLFLTLPIAARIYGKEDFGGLALAVGFVGLVQPLLTLRYEIAIVLPRSDAIARAIALGLFGIALAGYLSILVLVVSAPNLLVTLADPNIIANLRLPILLHIAATVLTMALTAWLQRKAKFLTLALSQSLGALTTAVLVIGAPLVLAPSLVVLFWGYSCGAVVSAMIACFGAVNSGFRFRRGTTSFHRVASVLRKYRVYPIYSLPLTLSSVVADRTLLLYMSSAFSLATLGEFFSTRQLLFGLVYVVTGSISQVVFAHAAQNAQKVSSLKKPLLTLASGIAVAAGLGLGWVYSNALEVTHVLLGEEWRNAATMMPWIATHGAMNAICGWQGRLLDVERRQDLDAKLQVGGDAVLLMLIGFLWVTSVSETSAVAAICTAGTLHGFIWLTVVYRAIALGAGTALRLVLMLAMSAASTTICAMVAKFALGSTIGALTSLGATGAAILIAISFAIRSLNRQVRS